MAGYQILSTLLKEELDQLTEEGRLFDREEMASRISEAENDRDKLMRLYTGDVRSAGTGGLCIYRTE